MNKQKVSKRKAVNYSGAIIISVLLITSVIAITIPSGLAGGGSFPPKTIYGTALKCNGDSADGASVVVSASGFPDEYDTVSGGAWDVDVGPDTGTEWPDGTSFTVSITLGSWSGSTSGTVNGHTNAGHVDLYPPDISASASASPMVIIAGDSVDFFGSATGGATPYDWYWDFDGAGSSSEQNPSDITFSSPGDYDCELTVTGDCGDSDSDIVTITVNPALSGDIGGPYTGDICECVQFDGTASGGVPPYDFCWEFGDGNGLCADDPCHLYDDDGTYTVELEITDSNSPPTTVGPFTTTCTISTDELSADADGPYNGDICSPVSVVGSASGGCEPYDYDWNFGDGGSGSGQMTSHQYDEDGSYTITLTVTSDDGQTDVDTTTVSISTDELSADAGGPYDANEGNPIGFSGDASGGCEPYDFEWNFGDGDTGDGQNPTHTYDDPGDYTVTLTVTDDAGKTDTDTASVTIYIAEVIADANGPYYGAVDEPVHFSGSVIQGAPPYEYIWNFGDGATSTEKNPSHIYETAKPDEGYEVILYVTDNEGNSDFDQTTAYISSSSGSPSVNAHGPYEGVVDVELQFTGSAFGGTPPYDWEWDFGDGAMSTEKNPSHTYTEVGTYDVTVTVTDDNSKTDTDTTTATIIVGSPDLKCSGSLSWSSVESGGTVSSSFTVENDGDAGTMLDWEILSYPDWGTWSFDPDSGFDLSPEDGKVTVEVSVVAPTVKGRMFLPLAEEEYSGEVEISNSEDTSDTCTIPVSMVVPKSSGQSPFMNLIIWLIQFFPGLEPIFI